MCDKPLGASLQVMQEEIMSRNIMFTFPLKRRTKGN